MTAEVRPVGRWHQQASPPDLKKAPQKPWIPPNHEFLALRTDPAGEVIGALAQVSCVERW